jgi:hypothetical protein
MANLTYAYTKDDGIPVYIDEHGREGVYATDVDAYVARQARSRGKVRIAPAHAKNDPAFRGRENCFKALLPLLLVSPFLLFSTAAFPMWGLLLTLIGFVSWGVWFHYLHRFPVTDYGQGSWEHGMKLAGSVIAVCATIFYALVWAKRFMHWFF